MDFIKHINRQLGFLERSCDSFDQGYIEEAIRIATVIRVLIHNTSSSTSLLKHLKATTINLLSTSMGAAEGTVFYFGLGTLKLGGEDSKYFASLGDGPIKNLIPVSAWWDQVVYE